MSFLNRRTTIMGVCMALLAFMLVPLEARGECRTGTYDAGGPNPASYLVCVPDTWNGDLVVFAHGYVSPLEPLSVVDYTLPPDGAPVSGIITGMGYAYATTSYSDNGLVIAQAVEDIRMLVELFPALSGTSVSPARVYMVGASEGGLVAALAMESNPVFSGGLAACGPVGDFRAQIDYFGDFLVLFNYFFPGVLASFTDSGDIPTPEHIPAELMERWDAVQAAVLAAMERNPSARSQLLRVSRIATDPDDPLSVQSVLAVLWYDLFATNDAIDKLGGRPYDNSRRWYTGSKNDFRLNLRIPRFHADADAVVAMEKGYQTSGSLLRPLVTLHTTSDPTVPYWHEPIYNLKTLIAGSLLRHLNIPIVRYGHCRFDQSELLTAFAILRLMAAGR